MTTHLRPAVLGAIAIALLPLLAVNCQKAEYPQAQAALTIPTACAPNDGLDDRQCLQDNLDALCLVGGGTLHLEVGQWDITRPTMVPGFRDNASLWLECPDLKLEGEGPATVLMMSGDGYGGDWAGVRVIAGPGGTLTNRVSLADMTIASDDSFNPNEQTHLVVLGSMATTQGPISNVQLHNLHLRHPVLPEVSGDCLRFVGELATPLTFVDVGSVVFEACDRSGISVQRGVQDVNLHNLQFINVGKTGIDMEPSGTGPIARFLMQNLNLANSGISIAGQNSTWTRDIVLANSYVGGRVGVIYAANVTLTGNVIQEVAPASEGTLNVRGAEDLVVTGNLIRRLAGSAPGPAVKISGVSGTYPNRLLLSANDISTEIAGPVLDMESTQDMTLSGNLITGNDPTSFGFTARATGRDIGGLVITGNRFKGPLLYAMRLSGAPSNVTGALVGSNYSAGVTGAGLRCENPAKFTKPVIHLGNMYDGAAVATSCSTVSVLPSYP